MFSLYYYLNKQHKCFYSFLSMALLCNLNNTQRTTEHKTYYQTNLSAPYNKNHRFRLNVSCVYKNTFYYGRTLFVY